MSPEWPIHARLASHNADNSRMADHEREVIAEAIGESPAYVKALDSLVIAEKRVASRDAALGQLLDAAREAANLLDDLICSYSESPIDLSTLNNLQAAIAEAEKPE